MMRAVPWLIAAVAVVPRAFALSIYDVATAEEVLALPQDIKAPLEDFETFIGDNVPSPGLISGQQCVKKLDIVQLYNFVKHLRQLASYAMSHPKLVVARIPRSLDYYYLPLGRILDYILEVDPAKLGNAPRSSPCLPDACKTSDDVAFVMAKAQINLLQMAFVELVGIMMEPAGASEVDLELMRCRQEIVWSAGVIDDLVMGANFAGQRSIPNALFIGDLNDNGWSSLKRFLAEATACLPHAFERYRGAVGVLCDRGLKSSNVGLGQFAPFPLRDAAHEFHQVLGRQSLDHKVLEAVGLLDAFYARVGLENLKLQFMLAPLHVQEHIEANSSALTAIGSFVVSLIRKRDTLKVLAVFDAVNLESLKALKREVESANDYRSLAQQKLLADGLRTRISKASKVLFWLNKDLISELDVKNPKAIIAAESFEKLKKINLVLREGLAAVEASIKSAHEKFETPDFDKFIVSLLGDWGIGKLLVAAKIFAEATDRVIAKEDRYDFDKLLPQELFGKHQSPPRELEGQTVVAKILVE